MTRTIVVKQSATKTTLSFTTPVIYGSETSEVFQVSVSSPSGAIPPGTVGVYNGTVLLCTATLNSTGNGSCNLSSNSSASRGLAFHCCQVFGHDELRSLDVGGTDAHGQALTW